MSDQVLARTDELKRAQAKSTSVRARAPTSSVSLV